MRNVASNKPGEKKFSPVGSLIQDAEAPSESMYLLSHAVCNILLWVNLANKYRHFHIEQYLGPE